MEMRRAKLCHWNKEKKNRGSARIEAANLAAWARQARASRSRDVRLAKDQLKTATQYQCRTRTAGKE